MSSSKITPVWKNRNRTTVDFILDKSPLGFVIRLDNKGYISFSYEQGYMGLHPSKEEAKLHVEKMLGYRNSKEG